MIYRKSTKIVPRSQLWRCHFCLQKWHPRVTNRKNFPLRGPWAGGSAPLHPPSGTPSRTYVPVRCQGPSPTSGRITHRELAVQSITGVDRWWQASPCRVLKKQLHLFITREGSHGSLVVIFVLHRFLEQPHSHSDSPRDGAVCKLPSQEAQRSYWSRGVRNPVLSTSDRASGSRVSQ